MCGLVGFLGGPLSHSERDGEALLQRMADTIIHRGPDDAGYWCDIDHRIGFGHRRLSVVDLSPAGHQPKHSACGRYVIAFNGEIYNHLELRSELEKHSQHFFDKEKRQRWEGHSDTETLLAAFAYWGVDETLKRTVGMFAIALWDKTEHRLHLIRDRLGEKPLYYGWTNGSFVFGSELKAIVRYPSFANEISRESLCLYLRHCYVPAPYSIYKNIFKLEPGCHLSLSLEDAVSPPVEVLRAPLMSGGLTLRRWWSLYDAVVEGASNPISDEKEAIESLESQLRLSIRQQSIADVPLGAFLSGGVDSSTIVALMQAEAKTPVQTFTIGFDNPSYNEAVYASAVAKHLGTEHNEVYLSPADALGVIPKLPHLYDEPFADSSQIPTYLVCAQARQRVTVALSGDAGDELFGGYNRYLLVPGSWDKFNSLPHPLRKMLANALLCVSTQGWDKINALVDGLLPERFKFSMLGDKLHKMAARLKTIQDVDDLYYSLVSEWTRPEDIVLGAKEPVSLLTRRTDWPALPDVEQRMMYLDAMTYLPDDILCKVDRAAMGVSLETRVPFLDHRVVELAWRLPLRMKIRDGQGKWALRQVLYKYVPRELIERPKQGFGLPLGDWLRGPLRDWAETLLEESRLKREAFFYPGPIRTRWQEHLSGKRNWEHSLWGVLMFQAWLENNQ